MDAGRRQKRIERPVFAEVFGIQALIIRQIVDRAVVAGRVVTMKIAGVGDQVDAAEIVMDVQGREIEFVVAAAIFLAAIAEHAVLATRNPLIEGSVDRKSPRQNSSL